MLTPRDPIYLDYNATTPVAPEVVAAMHDVLLNEFGNPSSSHAFGRRARAALENARTEVGALIGADSDEVIFTGSATEANNIALMGAARALYPSKRHLVVSAIEHPAVLEPVYRLQASGWRVSVVPVDSFGLVAPEDVARVIQNDTAIVSIMHTNNEVGTIQPIAEIAAIARHHGALLHTDAAQSPGKIGVNVDDLNVDLLTLAGHKFYATKGVGALYVRSGVRLEPHILGAAQERGLRPGTENVAAIVGLGTAAALALARSEEDARHLRSLRDSLHSLLREAVPDLKPNGHPTHCLPNTLSVSFPRVSARELLDLVDHDVAASVGSACHSEHDTVSGVLAAMQLEPARAMGTVRLSVGRYTTSEEIRDAAGALTRGWQQLVNAQVRPSAQITQ